jgi:hypothetical protein
MSKTKIVWVIQTGKGLIVGCFDTEKKAIKFINNSETLHLKRLIVE